MRRRVPVLVVLATSLIAIVVAFVVALQHALADVLASGASGCGGG